MKENALFAIPTVLFKMEVNFTVEGIDPEHLRPVAAAGGYY